MVMVFCPCGCLVIFVSDNPPEKEHNDKICCPACGLDFEKMAEWMDKNISIEMIA